MDHDLSNYDIRERSAAGVAMVVEHPGTGDPIIIAGTANPVTITLRGHDSDHVREARVRLWEERLAKLDETRAAQVQAGANVALTLAELDDDGVELCVAATVAWEGIVLEGRPLKCTPPNCRIVYRQFIWLREQVSRFMMHRANYV